MRVALLKGRSNYLCWHRLETALHDGTRDAATLAALRALSTWGRASDSGDLTELEDLADDHALRAHGHVDRRQLPWAATASSSTAASCVEARRDAQAADVVIVNHHLLLADLALKDERLRRAAARRRRGDRRRGASAARCRAAILRPVASSTRELESLLRDVLRRSARRRRRAAKSERRSSALGRAHRRRARAARQRRSAGACRGPRRRPRCATRCPTCGAALEALREALDGFADASAALRELRASVRRRARRACGSIAAADPDEGLRWFDFSTGAVAVHWTPLDVGAALAARIEAQSGVVGVRVGDARRRRRLLAFPEPHRRRRAAHARAAEPVRLRAQRAASSCRRALPDPCDESYVESLHGRDLAARRGRAAAARSCCSRATARCNAPKSWLAALHGARAACSCRGAARAASS